MESGKWKMLLFVIFAAFVVMTGCTTAPAQKPAQTIAPASAEGASLKDVQATVLSLAQQNTAIINAVQKSAQDADVFRTETKGGIASLTQNQFRVGQWVVAASRLYRLRILGPGPVENLGVVNSDSAMVRGSGLPGADTGPGVRGAVPGADAQVSVKKGPTMLQLIVAFLLGAVLSSVVVGILAALHQVLTDHILAKLGVIISWTWAKLVGLVALFRPKPAGSPAPTAPPAVPPTAK